MFLSIQVGSPTPPVSKVNSVEVPAAVTRSCRDVHDQLGVGVCCLLRHVIASRGVRDRQWNDFEGLGPRMLRVEVVHGAIVVHDATKEVRACAPSANGDDRCPQSAGRDTTRPQVEGLCHRWSVPHILDSILNCSCAVISTAAVVVNVDLSTKSWLALKFDARRSLHC